MASRELNIWSNGQLLGVWSWTRTGTHSLTYADSWLVSSQARALSLSLPITAGAKEVRGAVVKNFFDNLLPDNQQMRERVRAQYALDSTDTQELLRAIGRDCVGAIQLLPDGMTPDGYNEVHSTALDEADVEKTLNSVRGGAVLGNGGDDDHDFRISIAGAQEKTALLKIGEQWHRPHDATPTTHILKLPLGLVGNMQADMSSSVENEWLCARIMAALGFDVAATSMARFGSQKVLVVQRFDRRWADGGSWIVRLPQEDLCQASGIPVQKKYERDGGPGIQQCLALLASSAKADHDRLAFALANLAFWLLAATDGHAKNFSIFLHAGGSHSMTPLYDILSVWPIIGKGSKQLMRQKVKLAMAIRSKNAHYELDKIQTRHWLVVARQSGVDGAFEAMKSLVEQVAPALDTVEKELPENFPAQVWDSIRNGMLTQKTRFQAGLEST